jgi:hypothetical protein
LKPLRLVVLLICSAGISYAQPGAGTTGFMPLLDLSSFQNAGKNWRIAGDVRADLNEINVLKVEKGTGILVNLHNKKKHGEDLLFTTQHGDIDLELDYMMAKGSNSGIYMQGRYEVQLEDSWGKVNSAAGSNGGIYERWDESRPDGEKGYQGYAPRQNASRAPGLWQHLKISFQAPRFDANGRKIMNAKMLLVELNGVVIHENVELQGPTRGALGNDEKPFGPLRIQGDHGAVAFRNIKIINYASPRPELLDLNYQLYKGKIEHEPNYTQLTPESVGSSKVLSSGVSRFDNDFLVRYKGTLRVKEPGEYHFTSSSRGGYILIRINNEVVQPFAAWRGSAKALLPAGDLPFELLYSKVVDYVGPALTVKVSGPGIREFILTDMDHSINDAVDPILIDAPVNTMLRSFMDLPNGGRVVHAISVGSPKKVHYTYDLDKGALVQVWRGNFLDATPMWHLRGDGSSRPTGAVLHFNKPAFTLGKLDSKQVAWPTDTAGSSYRPKGYVIDEQDRPTFKYQIYGTNVSDAIRVLENGQGIHREITVSNQVNGLFARLAEGANIEKGSNEIYIIDGKSYYLNLEDASGSKPEIRDMNGRKELIIPIHNKLSYSLLF